MYKFTNLKLLLGANWQIENQQQRQVARRKDDERAATNKNLKELGILESDVTKISSRERNNLSQKGSSKRGNAALPALADSTFTINVDHMEALLDQEIDKLLKLEAKKSNLGKQVRPCLYDRYFRCIYYSMK